MGETFRSTTNFGKLKLKCFIINFVKWCLMYILCVLSCFVSKLIIVYLCFLGTARRNYVRILYYHYMLHASIMRCKFYVSFFPSRILSGNGIMEEKTFLVLIVIIKE